MNLKYSGFLFVVIVILEAINGLILNSTSVSKNQTQDLSEAQPTPEKSQTENGATTETVKIIIPNTSELIPKLKLNESSTTLAPIVSQSSNPTTTPIPNPSTTPIPVPGKGYWVVRNETSKTTCIIAEMAMQLNITYPGKDDIEKSFVLNVPKDAKANGSCSSSSQNLNIIWGPKHTLQINFKTNKTANNFFISELFLKINATVIKDAKNNESIWNFTNSSSEFPTPLDMSYKCSKVQEINLPNNDIKVKAVLSLRDTQFEAYMNKTKADFGAAQDCDSFDTPDIVPIAVGCALAILVLVVLVAYLIGRKRSQNRGYLSIYMQRLPFIP